MLQIDDTLTSHAAQRNRRRWPAVFLCPLLMLLVSLTWGVAWAQEDAFSIPLKSLNKIDPVHVVQFRLVELSTSGMVTTAELELDTRAGFKIYDHGLRFEYKSDATLNTPVPIKSQAQPPAKVVQDPFYNEPRAVHERGARFILTSDIPMTELGQIRIRFEACSTNTCLLPTYFLVSAGRGQTSVQEPKGESSRLTSGVGFSAPSPQPSAMTSSLASSPSETTSAPAALTPSPSVPSASSFSTSPNLNANLNANLNPALNSTVSPSPTPTPQPSFRADSAKDASLTDALAAEIQRKLMNQSWLLFPALFLAGLLMNLTPCVYPMIPITLNILSRAYRSHHHEHPAPARSSMPALMYALGIILSYSVMGVFAGMTGSLFGSLLQSKLVNALLAALMFLLGLTMLDVFDLSRVQSIASKIPLSKKSPYLSVVTMGAVSGLVAAPCTGPVLSMLLLLVGQTKDPLYGFALMSVFAAGFSTPYLVLGLVSQQIKRLPKAGSAMTVVKHIFAALMFSLSLYYLKYILHSYGILSFIYMRPPIEGVLAIVFLTVLFVVLLIRKPTSSISKIGLQVGLTLLSLWVALASIRGFVSAESAVLPSLNRINDPIDIPAVQPQKSDRVHWFKNWDEAARAAKEQRKGLIVDAWAQWCAACLKMDAEVWNEPGIEILINQHFIALKIDFTESNPQSEDLTKRWDLSGLPAVGIYAEGSDFQGSPTILFREAATVSSFHEAVQKIFNEETHKK